MPMALHKKIIVLSLCFCLYNYTDITPRDFSCLLKEYGYGTQLKISLSKIRTFIKNTKCLDRQ